MEKKNIKMLLYIGGIFLILIGFIISNIHILSLLLVLLGLVLLSVGTIINHKNTKKITILYILFYLLLALAFDSGLSMSLKKAPIFSYNVNIDGNSKVYNAIGYRVWECNGKYTVDKLYKYGYYCDTNNLDTVDANAFLSQVVENYDDYENTYVKLTGKISQKNGINYVEIQPYETTEITLNGYVNFADNITLRAMFNDGEDKLSTYEIYDSITIIGKVWNLSQKDDKYTILMNDTVIIDEEDKSDFQLVVNTKNSCEKDKTLLYSANDYKLYTSCIESILVKYDNNDVYELSSVLSSGKLSMNDIYEKAGYTSNNISDGSIMYNYDDFVIVECDTSLSYDIVIGSSDLSFDEAYCGVVNNE